MLPLVDEKQAHPGEAHVRLSSQLRTEPSLFDAVCYRLLVWTCARFFRELPGPVLCGSAVRVMILFLLRRDDGHSRPDVKREYSQCGYEPPLLTSGQPRGCGSDGVADCEGTAQGLKGMTLGETTRWKSRDFTRSLLL